MAGPGQDYSTFAELITEAHKQGLLGVTTQLHEYKMDENGNPIYAIVYAAARFEKGIYEGIGDATRENTNRGIGPHLIRMASTRAMARALRVALGVGKTAIEELGGSESVEPTRTTNQPRSGAQVATSHGQNEEEPERTPGGATVKAAGYLKYLAHQQYGSVEDFEENETSGKPIEELTAKQVKKLIEVLKNG